MNKLIFVDFHDEQNPKKYLDSILFTNEYRYKDFINKSKSNSNIHIFDTLVFEIKGKNYSEKKRSLQDIAGNFFCMFYDCGISQGELSIIQNWLESKAKLYGLTNEFRENAII